MDAAERIWRRYDAMESRLTAPVSERMLDLAGVGLGQRVLDLATGRGEPAVRAALRVGPEGRVVGIEPSESVLQMAREWATREGLTNLELRCASAEDADLPARRFHAATVRWGLMYMARPLVALQNVQRALVPEGILVAALWAEPERVPYYTLPRRLLESYRPMPPIDPDAPGTFRFADLDRIVGDFAQAGLEVEHVEEMDVPVVASDDLREVLEWVETFGLRTLLDELPREKQEAWQADLMKELRRRCPDGTFQLGGVTRIVVARARKR